MRLAQYHQRTAAGAAMRLVVGLLRVLVPAGISIELVRAEISQAPLALPQIPEIIRRRAHIPSLAACVDAKTFFELWGFLHRGITHRLGRPEVLGSHFPSLPAPPALLISFGSLARVEKLPRCLGQPEAVGSLPAAFRRRQHFQFPFAMESAPAMARAGG